jgi:methionyl-tRNA synthetase
MSRRVYVTTAIPYVNARPHLGFARELVLADCIARSQRLLGRESRLQTGTDENAFKNVQAARDAGTDTALLVKRHAEDFRQLGTLLQAEVAVFVRTADREHHRAVHRLWGLLRPEDLYRQRYTGLYCLGCEDFYQERDLNGGCCPVHGTKTTAVEEENVFFRLSRYQDAIAAALHSGRLQIEPAARRAEVLAFVHRGLRDISISRHARRTGGWGVPVPGDEEQFVYVWIDALINYLTGLGFAEGDGWRQWWNATTDKIHVIGKDVWKFHACYWPGLLLSAGLELPDTLLVHGFLTQEGRKISKSAGGVVEPGDYVARYGSDALRYGLLKIPPGEDGDLGHDRLALLYETDLANGLGNICRRVTALAVQAGYSGPVPTPSGWLEVADELASHRFDRVLDLAWRRIAALNRDIDRHKPWEALRGGDTSSLSARLGQWLGGLRLLGFWLSPILPDTARKIDDILTRRPLAVAEPLFPKLSFNNKQGEEE